MVCTETMKRPCFTLHKKPVAFKKKKMLQNASLCYGRTNWIHGATLGSEVAFTQAWNIKELTGAVKQLRRGDSRATLLMLQLHPLTTFYCSM